MYYEHWTDKQKYFYVYCGFYLLRSKLYCTKFLFTIIRGILRTFWMLVAVWNSSISEKDCCWYHTERVQLLLVTFLPILCFFLYFDLKQQAFVLFTWSFDEERIQLTSTIAIYNLQAVFKLQVLNLVRKRLTSNKEIFIAKKRQRMEEEVKRSNEKILLGRRSNMIKWKDFALSTCFTLFKLFFL